MNKYIKYIFSISLLFELFLVGGREVYSQISTSGIAIPVSINSESVQEGDIICTGDGGYYLCSKENDQTILGVVTQNPAAAFEIEGDEKINLVLSQGNVKVRVSNLNGNISEGDFITTSENQGVGVRAIKNGHVLGVAMEGFEGDQGKILVSLNIHYSTAVSTGAGQNLLEEIRQAFLAPSLAPLASLRYLLAFIIAIISFTLGFVYFGRVVKTGIEAIGRNPLARKMIQITMLFNILITIVIVLAGLAVAYLILIL